MLGLAKMLTILATTITVAGALGTSSASAGSCTSVHNHGGFYLISCGGAARGGVSLIHLPNNVVGQDGSIGVSLYTGGTQAYAFGIKADGNLDGTCIVNDTTPGPPSGSSWVYAGIGNSACDWSSKVRVYNYW